MDGIRTSTYMETSTETGESIKLNNSVKTFEGTVIVPKAAVAKGGVLYSQYKDFNKGKLATYIFWLLGIIALVTLLTVMKFQKEWVTEYSNCGLVCRFENRFEGCCISHVNIDFSRIH